MLKFPPGLRERSVNHKCSLRFFPNSCLEVLCFLTFTVAFASESNSYCEKRKNMFIVELVVRAMLHLLVEQEVGG
jgi:hypothetical protein